MAGRRHTANRRIAPPSPNCLKSKGAPRVGESFGDVPLKRRTDDANHLRRLGIHEHKAPSEQRLFPEIIKGVRPQRDDEDFARGQAVLMIAINLDPVFLGDIPQNHIDRGMVVLDSDVAVLHCEWIHVGVVVKNLGQDLFGRVSGPLLRQLRRQ